MEFDIWWDLVIVALRDVTGCYVEGYLIGTGECCGMAVSSVY